MNRRELIQAEVKASAVQQKALATDSDISPDTLLSWLSGRREPTADGILKLAAGFEARAAKLQQAAQRLRAGLTGTPTD